MFGSRAITSTQSGHRCAPSAKFKTTRQIDHNIEGRYWKNNENEIFYLILNRTIPNSGR
jgi:hypothetical protein